MWITLSGEKVKYVIENILLCKKTCTQNPNPYHIYETKNYLILNTRYTSKNSTLWVITTGTRRVTGSDTLKYHHNLVKTTPTPVVTMTSLKRTPPPVVWPTTWCVYTHTVRLPDTGPERFLYSVSKRLDRQSGPHSNTSTPSVRWHVTRETFLPWD